MSLPIWRLVMGTRLMTHAILEGSRIVAEFPGRYEEEQAVTDRARLMCAAPALLAACEAAMGRVQHEEATASGPACRSVYGEPCTCGASMVMEQLSSAIIAARRSEPKGGTP